VSLTGSNVSDGFSEPDFTVPVSQHFILSVSIVKLLVFENRQNGTSANSVDWDWIGRVLDRYSITKPLPNPNFVITVNGNFGMKFVDSY
jgi:hypothetical protein